MSRGATAGISSSRNYIPQLCSRDPARGETDGAVGPRISPPLEPPRFILRYSLRKLRGSFSATSRRDLCVRAFLISHMRPNSNGICVYRHKKLAPVRPRVRPPVRSNIRRCGRSLHALHISGQQGHSLIFLTNQRVRSAVPFASTACVPEPTRGGADVFRRGIPPHRLEQILRRRQSRGLRDRDHSSCDSIPRIHHRGRLFFRPCIRSAGFFVSSWSYSFSRISSPFPFAVYRLTARPPQSSQRHPNPASAASDNLMSSSESTRRFDAPSAGSYEATELPTQNTKGALRARPAEYFFFLYSIYSEHSE